MSPSTYKWRRATTVYLLLRVRSLNIVLKRYYIYVNVVSFQWYGNLVTFKTFSEAWLNEGFATYYGFNALEALGWPPV